ncbi:MAG: NusG domain II-containing protein [Candidatus Accumulibacter sp.]|nr:NusG domain II-containing protein [Accumulibacter sp.]
MSWLSLLRPGDCWVAIGGAMLCAVSFPLAWQDGHAEKAIVRRGGEVFAELDLSRDRRIKVPGPLGTTVIAVEKRRVRVVSDPGAHQYCVRQGWLERAGQMAICAPNEISVEVAGSGKTYDSLSY